MSDVPIDPRGPAEEDPVVHQHLVLLPAYSPRPGLADRVLTRVWLPIPPWLTRLQARWRDLVSSRRIWLLAAPFLVGSVVFAVALTVAVATHPGMARTAARFMIQHGARVALESISRLWAAVTALWSALALAGIPPAAALLAAAAIWAVCVWGLYRTLRVAVPVRKTVHAKR